MLDSHIIDGASLFKEFDPGPRSIGRPSVKSLKVHIFRPDTHYLGQAYLKIAKN